MNDTSERRAQISSQAPGAPGPALSGAWLVAGRVLWPLLLALILVPFGLSVPTYRDSFTRPAPQSTLLSPGAVAALARAGVNLATYAWISFGVMGAVVVFSLLVALALFWRRSYDRMALLVSLFIVVYTVGSVNNRGIGGTSSSVTVHASALQAALAAAQSALLFALTTGVSLLFPTGRFVPRWSWVLLVGASLWGATLAVAPLLGGGLLFLGYPILVGACVASIVYRYRRVSTPTERLQTRWIAAGFIVTLLGNQVFWLPSSIPSLDQTAYPLLVYQVYQLSLAVVPITFFVAVQRYHLYNIDTIINRALVYGTLTGMLAGIYFAVVLGVQTVARHLSGNTGQRPLVIVATTLFIAVLFTPLRRRLQAMVDRAFYRTKYDAGRTVTALGTKLRMETDLDGLCAHLVQAVQQTMQPAHVSLWLCEPAREREHKQGPDALDHGPELSSG
ncbi:MAG TPA: hypothetical protein VKQ30_25740 [Ktedonobacterales bacterium]|nr:hypothetical protein [Ktedonobacterales bacterium]